MKQRICAFLLAMLLLLGTAAACSQDAKDASTNTDGENSLQSEAADTEIRETLPEKTFDGKAFRIMIDEGTICDKDFIAEVEEGETLNDAVYLRNAAIEERFDIEIIAAKDGYGSGFATNLNTYIQANEDAYDVAMGMNNISTGITAMVYDGKFIDWNELEHVDLSKPWWDENVIRDLCFGSKIYCMTGDMHPSTLGNTRIVLFNKNLFQNLNLTYPYQLVEDGKWTYDEFFLLMQEGLEDLNGDGAYSYTDDRYGYIGWQWDLGESIYIGMGGSYVTKDSDGLPVLNLNNDRSYTIIDKMLALFETGAGGWQNNVDWGVDINIFHSGRSLFLNSRLYLLTNFRDMDDDFGILPHPMLNESQNAYYQSVDPVCSLAYIPITNSDLEFTSIILEAVAAESYRKVMPSYYDVILQTKYTRDNESESMIEIIKNSRYYPIQLDSFSFITFASLIGSGRNTFSSTYASKEPAALKELEVIVNSYG